MLNDCLNFSCSVNKVSCVWVLACAFLTLSSRQKICSFYLPENIMCNTFLPQNCFLPFYHFVLQWNFWKRNSEMHPNSSIFKEFCSNFSSNMASLKIWNLYNFTFWFSVIAKRIYNFWSWHSTCWFEAAGDVQRMIVEGRTFFCNWISIRQSAILKIG